MKQVFCVLFFLFILSAGYAQSVKLINIDKLETRVENGGDTVYVINFWATWCAPCVKELPYFEKLAKVHENKPLKVLLVSLDFKSKLEKDVVPFVKKNGLLSEVLLNESNNQYFINKVSKDWSGAIPATLIINRRKEVRVFYEKEFTFDELNNIYTKLL